jgi:glycine betaine transporter
VLLWAGGLEALQTLVILVAGPFMLVLIAMCVSTLKALREEPYESTLPPRVRRAVQHAQRHDRLQHQTIALATLGCDEAYDGGVPSPGTPKAVTVVDD